MSAPNYRNLGEVLPDRKLPTWGDAPARSKSTSFVGAMTVCGVLVLMTLSAVLLVATIMGWMP